MPFHDRFTLPKDDQHSVDPAWFDGRKQRRVQKNDPSLRRCLAEEVDALRAFHDGHTKADEAAHAITRPISTSPVPDLGGYSDEILAVNNLWLVIITALIEWPSARTTELFALLEAISKVPDMLHNGEALDDDEEKLTWNEVPYFALTWHETTSADLQPGQICRKCPDTTSLASARRQYVLIKDIEARLVAKHVMAMNKQMIQFIIRALEKNIDQSDEQLASDEATAYDQVKLNFHIPAVASLFKYNVREIHDRVVRDGLRDWTPRQMPEGARKFEGGAERWSFWERRLAELAQKDADDEVKIAAQAALESMSTIV